MKDRPTSWDPGGDASAGPLLPTEARALWIVAPGQSELRTSLLPPLGPGDALVRARLGALSRGTEGLVFRGEVPASEHERMRAPFQEGSFPAPVKYGYALVGEVLAGPEALSGRLVFGLLPHQTLQVVPADALHRLPDGLPPERAVWAANAETALNAVWDLGPLPGERIAVVGAGLVGCLVGWLLGRIPGTEVTLVDPAPGRRGLAAALGARHATPADDGLPPQDAVVHASGTEAGLARALSLVRDEGQVLELSWYGARSPRVPLGQDFHARRLTLRCSQVGQVAAPMRGRRTRRERLALGLRLLRDHGAVLDPWVDREVAFDDLPAALPHLLGPGADAADRDHLTVRIRYPT